MAEQPAPTETLSGPVCPWCSAQLAPEATVCPSCGANLTSDEEHELPGVTAIDHELLRSTKKSPGRSRILSWISGEYEPEGQSQVEAGALQPPDPNVQREILRLQLEAEVANLQAEADALYAEAVVDGRVSELPEGIEAIATGSPLSEVIAGLQASDETATAAPAEQDAGDAAEQDAGDAAVSDGGADAATDASDAPAEAAAAEGEDTPSA